MSELWGEKLIIELAKAGLNCAALLKAVPIFARHLGTTVEIFNQRLANKLANQSLLNDVITSNQVKTINAAGKLNRVELAQTIADRQLREAIDEAAVKKLEGRIEVEKKRNGLKAMRKRAIRDARMKGQLNVENIIQNSLKVLIGATESKVSDSPLYEDVESQFFDYCRNINDKDKQVIWGRILAREIIEPGSFSLRTLAYLYTMSKADAELFTDFCRFVWKAEDKGGIPLAILPLNPFLAIEEPWPDRASAHFGQTW